MKKVIKLTESELIRLVKQIIKEQEEGGEDEGGEEEVGEDSDYWGEIIKPALTKAGWKEVVDPNFYKSKGFEVCPYKCCTYMYKGDHNSGPNIYLDCGKDPKSEPWNITVYTKGNQQVKTFGTGDDAARKAVKYALTLSQQNSNCLIPSGFKYKSIGGPMTKRNVWEKTVDNITYRIPEHNGKPVTGLEIIDRKKQGYKQSCKSWSCDRRSPIGITYTDCVENRIIYY